MSVPLDLALIGAGEYTTGFTSNAVKSDKTKGVVGLVSFDLRRRGIVSKIAIVGTSGSKWTQVEEHFQKNIAGAYKDLDVSFTPYPPAGETRNPEAYKEAIDALPKGSGITIFTPDSTHHAIALYAISKGIHVLVTKPVTQKLSDHLEIVKAAEAANVYVQVEMHKRFDPAYADGKEKAKRVGSFNFYNSYMSQPKSQLETFKAWAGKDSDISYYLNSHHIDIHGWYLEGCEGRYVPTKVTASGSTGIATSSPFNCPTGTEDTISLLVEWQSQDYPDRKGIAVYTSSWTAPTAGVHSEQNFHFMGSKGEIRIDQSRRGYVCAMDEGGYASINPFYMNYSPDGEGLFAGQTGYGYQSIEKFVTTCQAINAGKVKIADLNNRLPTAKSTIVSTAILEAGRRSLDEKRSVLVKKEGDKWSLE